MGNKFLLVRINIFFVVLLQVSCNNRKGTIETEKSVSGIESIKFSPEAAESIPFNDLFREYRILKFQQSDKSNSISGPIFRTDSFLIRGLKGFRVYDTLGNLVHAIEKNESEDELLFYSAHFYADNNQITITRSNNWGKYRLNGSVVSKGKAKFIFPPTCFIMANDTTWLFYDTAWTGIL